jgi:3-deoxy-manno-octulosonate cytidylyltransferase (CMP-KDO synthetase)
MKIIAMIPARYAATRFPAKLMQSLAGKTVIRHTYENTVATGLFDEVFVITDSDIIFQEVISHGGKAIMSKHPHESGSDRIVEAITEMSASAGTDGNIDIVVNVQGDEPFVKKEPLEKLVQLFNDPEVMVGSMMRVMTDEQEIQNPNCVKVVVNKKNDALYFSRSVIPFVRNKESGINHYLHIGVYAYRKEALMQFTKMEKSLLENTEHLEQLRYLENGISIRMAEVDFINTAIDTPEDLEKARKMLG